MRPLIEEFYSDVLDTTKYLTQYRSDLLETLTPRSVPCFVHVVCLALLALPAAAQFSSAIQGTITDASKAAVPDATVVLKNTATGITRETTTSTEGFFRFSSLGAGTYAISVQKAGFAPITRDSIAVAITEVFKSRFHALGRSSRRAGGSERASRAGRNRAGTRLRPHRPDAAQRTSHQRPERLQPDRATARHDRPRSFARSVQRRRLGFLLR